MCNVRGSEPIKDWENDETKKEDKRNEYHKFDNSNFNFIAEAEPTRMDRRQVSKRKQKSENSTSTSRKALYTSDLEKIDHVASLLED